MPAPTYPSQYASVTSVAANDGTDPFALDCNPVPPAEFGAPGLDQEIRMAPTPAAGGRTDYS